VIARSGSQSWLNQLTVLQNSYILVRWDNWIQLHCLLSNTGALNDALPLVEVRY